MLTASLIRPLWDGSRAILGMTRINPPAFEVYVWMKGMAEISLEPKWRPILMTPDLATPLRHVMHLA